LLPVIRGAMLCMSITRNKTKGPYLRYLVLDPILGELAIFQNEKCFLSLSSQPKKQSENGDEVF